MKQFKVILLLTALFTTHLMSQTNIHPNDLLASKGEDPDTSIVTNFGNDDIDGMRTEIKSDDTGVKKADKTYRDLGFKASVQQYIGKVDANKMDQETILRIANSFRLNSQPAEAEYWYSQIIGENSQPRDMLRYAQVLQSNEKCEDATRWYKLFNDKASRKERKNRELVIDCEELKNIQDHPEVTLRNVRALNTGHLDFSPIPYRNGVIFSTTRKNDKPNEIIDSWTNDNFSDLFYSEFDEEKNKFKKPVALKGDLNKKFHDGAATFDQSGMVMYFTRNNNNGKSKSKDGLIDLKIYSANNDGEYWTNVTELPFNSNEFTSCHPTLSPDGKRLYFASNRPGGYGGLDIYVVERMGGMWKQPQNLGPTVNSAGNEIFPVMHEDGTLYYSSNGHQGLGGLDIFHANKTIADDESSWSVRENLGTPFNSPRDDFGFVLIEDGTHTGYFTSNRDGGKGKDDIYTWTSTEKKDDGMISRMICVYDEKTGDKLENASVTIMEKSIMDEANDDLMLTLQPLDEKEDKFILGITGKNKKGKNSIKNYETDADGTFLYKAMPGKKYVVNVERDGYNDQEMEVSYSDLKNTKDWCVPMNKKSCRMMAGMVVNKKYNTAMPNAEVEVLNKCTNEKQKFTTDETGAFEACIKCDCEYRIYATKSGFNSDTEFLSTINEDCNGGTPFTAKLELGVREVKVVTAAPVPAPVYTPAPAPVPTVPVTTYEEVITYVEKTEMMPITRHIPITDLVNTSNASFSEGQVISLKDVYYNFDKFDIREDASLDLEHVLSIMQTYPSLEIEMMSHTDSRGTVAYNNTLSTNRAKAARQYLIKKGIAGSRITARGYGETQLKNRCANGVECTEEEHQQNRRTEIKVTKFDQAGTHINQH